jgi:hypothetical protein
MTKSTSAITVITNRPMAKVRYVGEVMMQSAEMISNPGWRRSFLENELSNRDLPVRWKSHNPTAPERELEQR